MKKFGRTMRATRPLLIPPKPPGWGLFPSAYGHDPYNSTDQHNMARRIIRMWPGPLTSVATREHASWDFTPGDIAAKVRYYETHGIHRLPLRGLMARQAD